MQFLIVGLGNIGDEYAETRHNIGFKVLDALAKASNIIFDDRRYGFVQKMRVKNQQLVLLKPSTYMNLSGNAVRYWMQKENIPLENVLVVVDDISLPLGALRLRAGGSEAGHNGLRSISQQLGTQQYARLRFGIGNNYPRGMQADYVLSPFLPEENSVLQESIPIACDIIKTFALSGIDFAMNQFNKRKSSPCPKPE
ncbi:MAG: aminoacyl-tRNA hydrolase [Alloprevotella sp.]|nr:aminoacyl-tRNA hydrolase [Alloprevotella sp.]